MSQSTPENTNLTKIFQSLACATGLATVFNAIFAQWLLVAFFGVVFVATGLMALRKMKQEKAEQEALERDSKWTVDDK